MLEKQFYLYFIFQHFSSKAPHFRLNHLEAMRNHVLWLFKPASHFLPDTWRLRDVLNWFCTPKFISLSGTEIANEGKCKRRTWFSDKLSESNTRGSSSPTRWPLMCTPWCASGLFFEEARYPGHRVVLLPLPVTPALCVRQHRGPRHVPQPAREIH